MPLIPVIAADIEPAWLRIEKHIKLGNIQAIEQLLHSDSHISMNTGDDVNLYIMLEAAVSHNQREIVHAMFTSKIGMQNAAKLLCHRYFEGETILMIAVTNGALDIASDLLEYYGCSTIHVGNNGKNNHVFPYLNMRDDHGRTLLMKVCSMDRTDLVHWVLARYLNQKIELKTLIEARDHT